MDIILAAQKDRQEGLNKGLSRRLSRARNRQSGNSRTKKERAGVVKESSSAQWAAKNGIMPEEEVSAVEKS